MSADRSGGGDKPGPTNFITPEGMQKLQDEIAQLWKVERPQVTRDVSWAASLGDRSENAASYFHGAAVMLPKRVIDECGLMPEAYFLYYEELDWSKIVRDHGYQLKVCTETSVLHKESITTGKDSPLKTYYQTRNRVVFMNKHAEPAHRLVFNLFFHGISLPAKIVKHAIKGRMAHISALLRASYHASIQKKMGMSF